MKLAIGNDHAGVTYKEAIVSFLKEKGHEVVNYGSDTQNSVDYADFIHPVAECVAGGKADFGIIICGSGNGANITANKHQQIRAALCWIKEIAHLARAHNNANILSIPARYTSQEQVIEIVDEFLKTPFEGGRHQRRISKIACN